MSQLERVLKSEVSVSNIYDQLGYFTRYHIDIYPDEGSTTKVSDIDVIAIKHDASLSKEISIIEVKEQSNKFSDLFKLYGFKTYFGDCNSVFVTNKIHPRTIPIADELNIKLLTFSKLKEISDLFENVSYEPIDEKYGVKLNNYLKEVKNIDQALFWRYNYLWIELNPFKRFYLIYKLFQKTIEHYEKEHNKEEFTWYRRELYILSYLCAIEIASKCMSIDKNILETYIENNFLNIGMPMESKIKIKESLDSIVEEIKKIGLDFDFEELELTPKYVRLMYELVLFMIRSSKYLHGNLLVNETLNRRITKGDNVHISELISEPAFKKISEMNSKLLLLLHNDAILPDFSNFI